LNAHPLAVALTAAAHGQYPPVDGRVDVVPSPGPTCDALVAFTGHYVLAADVDAEAIAARWPVGALSLPFAPASLAWLAGRLGRTPLTHDVLFVTLGDAGGPPGWLQRDDGFAHPRVDEASRHRTIDEIWTDDRGSVVTVGRGLCGRWEVGYEVAAEHRNEGLGRRLVAAARGLVRPGEPLWAQVAPGNAASLRSTLAAGFIPVGAEVLFATRRRSGGPDG
jgi:GNAT superfamily N-acetyltransferase